MNSNNNPLSLKEQKEASVRGHSGTTPLELLIVSMSAPIGLFLFLELRHLLKKYTTNTTLLLSIIESTVILLPMTICQTVFLWPYGLYIMIIEFVMASSLCYSRQSRNSAQQYNTTPQDSSSSSVETPTNTTNKLQPFQKQQKVSYVSFYRSIVSYMTFIAILAVDFPKIFPRKFVKTEVSGYGLMDLGAGSFVVSAAFCSNKQRIPKVLTTIKRKCLPLLIMGMLRLITTKGLEYQEHVSEYGVHWNFFFTLSVVYVLADFGEDFYHFKHLRIMIIMVR